MAVVQEPAERGGIGRQRAVDHLVRLDRHRRSPFLRHGASSAVCKAFRLGRHGAIGNAGASNAALFAAAMLASDQPAIGQALDSFRARQTEDVMAHDDPRQ